MMNIQLLTGIFLLSVLVGTKAPRIGNLNPVPEGHIADGEVSETESQQSQSGSGGLEEIAGRGARSDKQQVQQQRDVGMTGKRKATGFEEQQQPGIRSEVIIQKKEQLEKHIASGGTSGSAAPSNAQQAKPAYFLLDSNGEKIPSNAPRAIAAYFFNGFKWDTNPNYYGKQKRSHVRCPVCKVDLKFDKNRMGEQAAIRQHQGYSMHKDAIARFLRERTGQGKPEPKKARRTPRPRPHHSAPVPFTAVNFLKNGAGRGGTQQLSVSVATPSQTNPYNASASPPFPARMNANVAAGLAAHNEPLGWRGDPISQLLDGRLPSSSTETMPSPPEPQDQQNDNKDNAENSLLFFHSDEEQNDKNKGNKRKCPYRCPGDPYCRINH